MYPATEQIIKIIQKYGAMVQDLDYQMKNIVNECVHLNQNIYRYTAFQSIDYENIGYGSNISNLGDVLKKMSYEEQKYYQELEESLEELQQEINFIRRIHLCYMSLPYKEHELLRMMYEEKLSWNTLIKELDISRSTVSRRRSYAIKMIQIAYASDLSNTEILYLQKGKKRITWELVLKNKNLKHTDNQEKGTLG